MRAGSGATRRNTTGSGGGGATGSGATGSRATGSGAAAVGPAAAGDASGAGGTNALVGPLTAALRQRGLKLGVAESCTGGLLGAAITALPGASDVFLGGFITYDDSLKTGALGVDSKKLQKHGAVSAWTAEAMADGVRKRTGADMAIAITGVAGPDGGTARKPVGTVWIGIEGPEHLIDVQRHRFEGDRDAVRQQAVDAALRRASEMVSEAVLEGVA